MRVAVYTIALNEEQNVRLWAESAKESDYLFIGDTGSTDNTVAIARELGVTVLDIRVKPWRFEMARNALLASMPEDVDYCIALDMDEQLQPGWREHMETLEGSGITRPRYTYTWSWNPDGTPGLQYSGDKIHSRWGYRWKHPVHEVGIPYGIPEVHGFVGLEIHHHPDSAKSRGQYLPMLEMGLDEDPEDDRNTFYLAREYFFREMWDKAVPMFRRHIEMPRAQWPPEKSASMRYLAQIPGEDTEYWLLRSGEMAPGSREPWVDLARFYYLQENWGQSLWAAEKALDIKEKPLEFLCETEAWGAAPHDYAAIAAFNLGLVLQAEIYAKEAVNISPEDARLQTNLLFCRGAVALLLSP